MCAFLIFTLLVSNTRAGRPDYTQYFAQLDGWRKVGDLVGVFSCGPQPMIEAVRAAGAEYGFACHEESFEF